MVDLPRALVLPLLLASAPAIARAGWESKAVAGLQTEIYTPASVSPVGDGRGLLIVLHGCTQTAAQLATLANLGSGAEDFGVVMAAPLVPGGGVYAGCWDYYGVDQSRQNRHNDDLLALVDGLIADADLAIDPDQVYIAGLSSGAGEALVLGCLAPDVFAGVGLAAAPGLGTEVFEFSTVATTAAESGALCQTFAGAAAASFADQLAVIYSGSADFTVAQGYAPLNVEMLSDRYGGGLGEATFDVATVKGSEPAGQGWIWSDGEGPRIARIFAQGGGHAWPAGMGAGLAKSYVEPGGVDLGAFMADFFTTNNRRVDAILDPTTSSGSDSDSESDGSSSDGTSSGSSGGTTATGGGTTASSGSESDGESSTSSTTCDSAAATDTSSAGESNGGSAGSASAGLGHDRGDDGDGCGCRTDPSPATPTLATLFLIALAGRRRPTRRASRRTTCAHPPQGGPSTGSSPSP